MGAANVVGLSYFWLVVLAIVVGVGSLLGPWLVSVSRLSAVRAAWLICSWAPCRRGRSVFSTGGKAASSVVTGGGSAAAAAPVEQQAAAADSLNQRKTEYATSLIDA